MNNRCASLKVAALLAMTSSVAAADDGIKVLTVLAPGSGSNYISQGVMPAGTDSQVQMYDRIPDDLENLDRASLSDFFKPATFDVAPDDMASAFRLRPGVRIVRDKTYNIPHVYGETREDAMFGVGFVRAEDRLWQMESFRAVWRAESAVFLGRGDADANILADAATFRLIDYSETEYQAMFDRLKSHHGYWGKLAASDIEAYVSGMNAYLARIQSDASLLPVEYVNRGIVPKPWRVTDVIAMAAYSHVAWGSAGPGEEANAQLLRQLQLKFGNSAQDIYADLRNAPGDDTRYSLPAVSLSQAETNPSSLALPDIDSFVPRQIVGGNATPVARVLPVIDRKMRSNALLVAARHSATGKPIAVQGPQDGYGTPHLFDSEIVVVAPDFKARGILELSGPYPYVAARGENYAWSITILPPDQADTFVEILCEPDGSEATALSMHSLYRGECLPFKTRVDNKRLPDGGTYALTSERSVHGPIIGRATVEGRPVALSQARTMYLHEEMDFPAHAQLFSPSVIQSAADFIEVVAGTAYNIGWWYVDDENIAAVDAGLVPVRRAGAATDLPVWGTGAWDWMGFDPGTYTFRTPSKSRYPQAIDGTEGVLAGWNNPSASGWSLKDEAWSYGSTHRVQLLREPTVAATGAGRISIEDLVKIHTRAAITDFEAQRVYPVMRQLLGKQSNSTLENLLVEADAWSASGGYLRDFDGDGFIEYGRASMLLDAFWQQLVPQAFEPLLGSEILHGGNITNNLPATRPGPDDADPWIEKISSGVQQHLGTPARIYSRNYCGETKSDCRDLLAQSLLAAFQDVRARYGENIEGWKIPSTCDQGCRQIEFSPSGDMTPVDPIGWQNRGTYIQVTTGE